VGGGGVHQLRRIAAAAIPRSASHSFAVFRRFEVPVDVFSRSRSIER
jgi:hypothetical protein